MFRPSRVPNHIAPVRFAHHGRANWLHCGARLSGASGPHISWCSPHSPHSDTHYDTLRLYAADTPALASGSAPVAAATTCTSLQLAHTWSDSSQSHRHCSTYRPGDSDAGRATRSTTSTLGSRGPPFDQPEQRHSPCAAPPVEYPRTHAALSSQTGRNVGPSRSHRPDGIGFFRHEDPAGTVPVDTCQPRAALSNRMSVALSPSHRSADGPSNASGSLRKVFSVRGASAGASRYA
mmetsp:Transcript_27883/g.89422  ORF Transcript_27883/g.89422 Transcript_27883/m.89422 type:complete len:235 (+) Transcript_27883:86-790(+)